MNERETRMRSVEAVYTVGGITNVDKVIQDAKKITEFVMAGEDNAPRARGRPPKSQEDKA